MSASVLQCLGVALIPPCVMIRFGVQRSPVTWPLLLGSFWKFWVMSGLVRNDSGPSLADPSLRGPRAYRIEKRWTLGAAPPPECGQIATHPTRTRRTQCQTRGKDLPGQPLTWDRLGHRLVIRGGRRSEHFTGRSEHKRTTGLCQGRGGLAVCTQALSRVAKPGFPGVSQSLFMNHSVPPHLVTESRKSSFWPCRTLSSQSMT